MTNHNSSTVGGLPTFGGFLDGSNPDFLDDGLHTRNGVCGIDGDLDDGPAVRAGLLRIRGGEGHNSLELRGTAMCWLVIVLVTVVPLVLFWIFKACT